MKRNKNKNIAWIVVLSMLFVAWSCNDYEKYPADTYTLDYIFSPTDSVGHNALDYLQYSIYRTMKNGHSRFDGNNGDYLDAASDDAVTSAISETEINRLQIGQYSAVTLVTSEMYWFDFYNSIRRATNFVNNIDVVPVLTTFGNGKSLLQAWKAEARFLRAYFYFELVKRYGGVPLMGDVLYETGDDVQFPRNSFEECVNFIVSELDAIKDNLRTLPLANPGADAHVATKEAALALKCKVLLYAASPLFNGQTLQAGNNLVGYTDYSAERWKKAADEAKAFINTFGPNGTDPKFQLISDFRDVFLNYYTNQNKELIFFRNASNARFIETKNGPVGFSGDNQSNGRTSPTQQLVDAFPMLDGKPISAPGKYPYNPINPYANRDPRLRYTILYNGSQWLNTTLETFSGGISNPESNTQKTKTSYYSRKFMGKFETSNNYSNHVSIWQIFRYAEILLNFAEAQNEYSGPSSDVYQAIIDLRKRAGIEAGDDNMYGLNANMTKEQMREIIRNERRIEMAFEEHRFYDIRRWRIAEDIFSKPLTGRVIIKQSSGLEFNEIEVLNAPFQTRRYLHPIPYTEVIKNDNMVQNPGWE